MDEYSTKKNLCAVYVIRYFISKFHPFLYSNIVYPRRALALEMTVGKTTWEPNTNFSFLNEKLIRTEQRSKLA